MIPASIATTIIWILCELGAFTVTKHVASWWLIYTTPNKGPIGETFLTLLHNLITTWTREWNVFEPNQWTLLPLLKGAFLVYIMLFGTAYMRAKYRMIVCMAMYVYYYIANDRKSFLYTLVSVQRLIYTAEFGIHFFFGAFLCDLSQLPAYTEWISTRRWPGRFLTLVLLFIGLLFCSYPEHDAEFVPWSNALLSLSKYIFPPNHPDTPRFYTGLGLTLISLAIHFSDISKTILSNKYLLWAGKNSFAVYLLHGTLIRTILVWMLYGISAPKDTVGADGSVKAAPHLTLGSPLWFWICIPIWFCILYYIANLWTTYVDTWAGTITKKLEKATFRAPEEEKSIPLLPQ